ncbi:type IV secretion system protein [Bartonella rattaustraliani]|uniref:type IV secretion system protein n=1 Tax=Bartonella rattaustraliani TaxID=481139 RepID=UPI00030E3669|nr:type IV secretion system protein [Bartonella rattaustraliani]
MKKVMITLTTTVILGSSHSAMAFTFGAGAANLGSLFPSWSSSTPTPKPPTPKPSVPWQKELIELLKKKLEVNKKQLEQTEKIHKSMTGAQKFKFAHPNYTNFFIKDPQLLYKQGISEDKNMSIDIAEEFKNVLTEENVLEEQSSRITDQKKERRSIEKRKQYAEFIDKAVSLKAFNNAQDRSAEIMKLLKKIEETKNLKELIELQAYTKVALAMIQNENAKLQMVAHLRNAEQALISQKKYKRNMRILNSENRIMPTIRAIK